LKKSSAIHEEYLSNVSSDRLCFWRIARVQAKSFDLGLASLISKAIKLGLFGAALQFLHARPHASGMPKLRLGMGGIQLLLATGKNAGASLNDMLGNRCAGISTCRPIQRHSTWALRPVMDASSKPSCPRCLLLLTSLAAGVGTALRFWEGVPPEIIIRDKFGQ
jgi:hypothetical protein